MNRRIRKKKDKKITEAINGLVSIAERREQQRQVREHAAELQAELSKAQEASVNAERFMNIVRRHISFEELTPTLLREFIEKIVVHECSYDENKHRRQEIEIYYSFVGKVDLPDE